MYVDIDSLKLKGRDMNVMKHEASVDFESSFIYLNLLQNREGGCMRE
jgi:hypothetical protein